MTYENGSTRGLVVKKSDDTIIQYRETVRRHFITSLSTCEVTAQHRTELLNEFYRYRQTAIEEGSKEPVREYVLVRRGDTSTVDKLAQLMVEHGAELKRVTAAFTSGGKEIPAGSYMISLAQPAKRLIRVMMDAQVSMAEDFLKAEEARRQRRQRSEIYDVTAWSLPLQYNVEVITAASPSNGKFEPVKLGATPAGRVEGKTSVTYIVPWGTTAAGKMLAGLLRQGYRVLSNDRPFTLNGTNYGMGALILKVKDNPASLEEAAHKLAESTGAEVRAHETTWVDEGPTFGSQHVNYVRKPTIAMAWDRPTNAGSAGQTRFVLERQFDYPVTVVRTQQLAAADLAQFQTIILPDAGGGAGGGEGYAGLLGANGIRRLKDWVSAGGTLVAIGGAVGFLADPRTGLLSTAEENALKPGETPAPTGGGAVGGRRGDAGAAPAPGGQGAGQGSAAAAGPARVPPKLFNNEREFESAIQPDNEMPASLHGALAKIRVDRDHWIGAGVPETVYALVAGRSIFQPVKIDRGFNVTIFAPANEVLASGYMWAEYRRQLAFKPFVIVERSGRGNVIAFTADPNYRAYMDGLNLLFLNAVFRGPAHQGGGRGGARK